MRTKSLWNNFADIYDHQELQQDITVDVAIIGGGITGLTAGKLLNQKGMSAAILESRKIGGGTTSHSTGNLYYTVDDMLSSLQSKYDIKTVKAVAESRSQALEQLTTWITEYDLDCDYRVVPWFLYSSTEKSEYKIDEELAVSDKAELSISPAEEDELPFPSVKAIKIPRQAQINPMRYVQEMARALQGEQCRIYESAHVSSIREEEDRCILTTPGGNVTAKYVIHASHTPKGVMFVQTLLGPYREYGIACKVRNNDFPDGIFWGYYEREELISIRNYSREGEYFIIVVGEPHKVGQAKDNISYIRKLESFAQNHFDVQEIAFRWGGQHYRSADLLPYIGPRKKDSREFIATGYSTNGLIYGTLAGMILSDLISGRTNVWAELYDAARKRPLKSASKFLKENVNVARQYLEDLPGASEEMDLKDLKAGKGKIIEKDGQKLAVYRREDGKTEIRSAVCTHLKCIVNWNNAERSWDCPCHGSRFSTDGSVLEGPAIHPLAKVRFSGDSVDVESRD